MQQFLSLALFAFFMNLPSVAVANEDYPESFEEADCYNVFETLMKETFLKSPTRLSDEIGMRLSDQEIASLRLVAAKDIDPGSLNIDRIAEFELIVDADGEPPNETALLRVRTRGDFFCSSERFQQVLQFSVRWDL